MTSGQDGVDPATVEREPVLEQHLDVGQASLDQIAREHRNAPTHERASLGDGRIP